MGAWERGAVASERFEIGRKLGSGGMGVVYEAFDRERNATVALKVLRRLDAQSIYLLKNEFRAVQGIRHPNLVSLGELFESEGKWFFTMELLDGVDLLSFVRGAEQLTVGTDPTEAGTDPSDALLDTVLNPEAAEAAALEPPTANRVADEGKLRSVLVQLTRGVEAMHNAGKVHRDIKPANVRVTSDGRVVLLDFGLIADASSDAPELAVAGTAPYMAPEQASATSLTPAADCYSIGVILYEALTGRQPFRGTVLEILTAKQTEKPRAPSTIEPSVPEDLEELCMSLLRIDPDDRPDAKAILRSLGEEPSRATPLPASAPGATFVGRTHELTLLERAFEASRDRVRDSEPTVVYVHGESGLGKSALIHHFITLIPHLADGAAAILVGRCYEREELPYKAFDGVIDALSRHLLDLPVDVVRSLMPRDAALLVRAFPVLRRVPAIAELGAQETVGDALQLRSRLFRAVRELFSALCERSQVVIAIDDVQWADAASLLLLSALVAPPSPPPILLIIASRTPPEEVEREVPGVFAGRVHVIEIGPLPPPAARKLARGLLRALPDSSNLSASLVAMEAKGHPLFIDELVRHLGRTARGEDKLRLDDVMWARIEQLGAPARRLLELSCVAGTPLPRGALRRAADLAPGEFFDCAAAMSVDRLLRAGGTDEHEPIEPYHDRVREAVSAHLDDERRIAHNADLAGALQAVGLAESRPELMLRFLRGAGELFRAARYAEEAAPRALAAFAFTRAAELYRTALELGDHGSEEARRVKLLLAEALANAGRGAASAEVFLEASEGAESALRVRCRQRAMVQLLEAGHMVEAYEVLSEIVSDVGIGRIGSPMRHLASLLWRRVGVRVRRHRWRSRPEEDIPAAQLLRVDTCSELAIGLAMIDTIRAADYGAQSMLMALKLGEDKRCARCIMFEAMHEAAGGPANFATAEALRAKVQPIVESTGDPGLLAISRLADGLILYFKGQLAAADTMLDDCERLLSEHRRTLWLELNLAQGVRISANRLIGRIKHMGELLDRYLRDAADRGNVFALTTYRRNGNIVWLARGQLDIAKQALEEATWRPPPGQVHIQHFFDALARGELALYERRGPAAREELGGEIDRFKRSLTPKVVQMTRADTFWLRGRLALSCADAGNRSALREASRMGRKLVRENINYARAWGRLLEAAVRVHNGDGDGAATALEEAMQAARESDLFLVEQAARRRLGELRGGDEGEELVSSADEEMRAEDVAAPELMTEVMAPGFARC